MAESIWTKMSKIDARWLFLFLWIVVLAPFIVSISLPMKISALTNQWYNYLNDMPDGSVVLWSWDVSFAGWSEMEASGVAVTKLLRKLMEERDFRIIMIGHRSECGPLPEIVLKDLGMHPDQTAEYGKKYCHLGYMAGGSVAMINFAKDIRSVMPVDWWGTPLDDLPVMDGINTIQDIDLCIYIESGGTAAITQWVIPYGTNLMLCSVQGNVPGQMPNLQAGLIKGMLGGLRGGAELEKLTGFLGVGNINITAFSSAHLVIMAFMVLANITFFIRRARREI